MILKETISEFCQEMGIKIPEMDQNKVYTVAINSKISVLISECLNGFALQAQTASCPKQKREDLFIHLMHANFLGQGTGGGRIGLDADEKVLTLSHGFPYEVNYQGFKEKIEDFVNFVVYWRDEIAKFERES